MLFGSGFLVARVGRVQIIHQLFHVDIDSIAGFYIVFEFTSQNPSAQAAIGQTGFLGCIFEFQHSRHMSTSLRALLVAL